jgi:hypothetical protein
VLGWIKYKKLAVCTVLLLIFFTITPSAGAHRSGCHRWHSCPSDTGSYVCGDLGYYSECPANSTPVVPIPAPTPPPAPVITQRTISEDSELPFSTSSKSTNKEYVGYQKVLSEGVKGKEKIYYDVTYTNGAETARKETRREVILAPIDRSMLAGSRVKPTASFVSVSSTNKKDKFNVKGKATANSEVVLSIEGKKIKRTKTDSQGNFVFKNIKFNKETTKIRVYNRINKKESPTSEITEFNKTKNTIKTDYQKLHDI